MAMISFIDRQDAKAGKYTVNVSCEIFDDVSEIVNTNKQRPHLRNNNHLLNENIDNFSFFGVHTYDEAEDMALNGWEEIVENANFKQFYNNFAGEENKLTKIKNDVVGYAPIIPNVLKGIPNCMLNTEKRKVKSKVINVVYNISVVASISQEKIMQAGLKLMSAILDLEKQGFRIRLTAMQEFSKRKGGGIDETSSNRTDVLLLHLKNEYKKIDLYSIMFPLIHPAMFRVHGFNWHERSPYCRDLGCGYGTDFQFAYDQSIQDTLREVLNDNHIVVVNCKDILNNKMSIEDIEKQILNLL